MPEDVDDTLSPVGPSLFPGRGELGSTCSCSGKIAPCAHATAVHYVLATALDADPFLLTTLRGRDRDRLLDQLRAARSGEAAGRPAAAVPIDAVPIDAVPIDAVPIDAVPIEGLPAESLFTAGPGLESIALHPRQPDDTRLPEALRLLGPPPGADSAGWQQLVDLSRRAGARAWALAGDGISASDREAPLEKEPADGSA